MRTTLTIDDPLFEVLKRTAAKSGKSFKQVVNETLRAGLMHRSEIQATAYRLTPVSLGQPRPGIDLDKALYLASDLEDAMIAEELERGR